MANQLGHIRRYLLPFLIVGVVFTGTTYLYSQQSGGPGGGSGGGGTPGGANTQVQFNNAGAFGGDATFTFNSTSKQVLANQHAIPAYAASQTNGFYQGSALLLHNFDPGNNPYSLFVGNGAGNQTYTTAGSEMTGIGYNALHAVTTGATSTCVGAFCLSGMTTGRDNTCIGMECLISLTSASSVTAVGKGACGAITTQSNCTAFGAQALLNTTVQTNTAVGSQTLMNMTTGNENTGVGQNVLRASVSDGGNTGVGQDVLVTQNGGNFNTAIGGSALFAQTTGADNTAVGYEANGDTIGTGAGTIDHDSVFIGHLAGRCTTTPLATALNNVIVIGQNAKPVNCDTANSVTIGNANITLTHLRGTVDAAALQTSTITAVGSLPTCNAGAEGTHRSVNDANATFTAGIGAVVAGGGANHVPVYCDGTNWRIG